MSEHELQKYLFTFNVPINNLVLFQQAITHRSYLKFEDHTNINLYNESLEFLGDSVLGFVISSFLYNKYPTYSEGTLSKIKNYVVSKTVLYEISLQMHIEDVLCIKLKNQISDKYKISTPHADAVEAVIAAVYLDQGLECVQEFVLGLFVPFIEKITEGLYRADYKSLLQDYTQKNYNIKPKYTLVRTEGPDHNKSYFISVSISQIVGKKPISNKSANSLDNECIGHEEKIYGPCRGNNKKQAEQEAAKLACEMFSINSSHDILI